MYFAVSFFALMPATPVFAAPEPDGMTLRQAVSNGILKNPEYGATAMDSLAAREVLSQARALYLPSLDLSSDSGEEYTDTRFVKDQSFWRNRASLSLTQLLFDGWGSQNQVAGKQARAESSAGHAGETAEFTGMDTVEAYLDVLRRRDLLVIAYANVDEHRKILDMISLGAKAGTVTQGDVAQARARLAQSRATVVSAEESLRRSESLFNQKTGAMPGDLATPEIPRNRLPASVEDAVHQALAHNPTLGVASANIKAAEADHAVAESAFYPRAYLEADASVGDNLGGIAGNENRRSVLATMKWSLYRGGADTARLQESKYRQAAAKERRDMAARQVEKDTRDAWAGMVSSADRSGEFQDQAAANEKIVSVYFDQFSLGRRTLLDVLDAQNELFASRSNALNAGYAEKFAVFRLLALQGSLLETLGVPKPREALLKY
jgi:adhesin transport system outer membrane protein